MRKLTLKRVEMYVRVIESQMAYGGGFPEYFKLDYGIEPYVVELTQRLQVKKPKDLKQLRTSLEFIVAHRKVIAMLLDKEDITNRVTAKSRGSGKSMLRHFVHQYQYGITNSPLGLVKANVV